jgi:hypothetical protein
MAAKGEKGGTTSTIPKPSARESTNRLKSHAPTHEINKDDSARLVLAIIVFWRHKSPVRSRTTVELVQEWDFTMRFIGLGTLVLSGLLAACGGGGGGSSSGSSSSGSSSGGTSTRGAFTVSRTTISLTGKRQTLDIPQLPVNVTVLDTASVTSVVAGYRAGVTPAPWLQIHASGSGANFTFNFVAFSGTLTNGTYQTTVTITTRDISGNDLQGRDIDVSFTLRDGVVITPVFSRNIEIVEGSPEAFQTFQVTVEAPASLQWQARSNVPWLTVGGETRTGPQSVSVSLNADGVASPSSLTPGQISLTNINDTTDVDRAVFRVSINSPTFALATTPLVIGGATGLEYEPIPLSFSIGTGTRAHPFTATVNMTNGAGLVRTSMTNGMVSAAGSSVVVEAVDRATTTPGNYAGTVRVQVTLPQSVLTREVPFTYNVEQNRLFVEHTGVAFSSFPTRSVLTRAVRVHDTQGSNDVPWQAASSRAWLAVTPSGNTGQPVTLTADPAGLAEGFHEGEVTVTTDHLLTQSTQAIRVGLTVRNTDPAAAVTVPVTTSRLVAANPVSPEFYSAEGNLLQARDAYSGVLLRTLRDFGEPAEALDTSDDGTMVYALMDTWWPDSRILAIRTSDGTLLATHDVAYTGLRHTSLPDPGITFVRPDGRPILAGSFTGHVDLTTGARNSPGFLSPPAVSSPDQRRYYSLNSPDVLVYSMRYSSTSGFQSRRIASLVREQQPPLPITLGRWIGLSSSGSRLYLEGAMLSTPDLVHLGRPVANSNFRYMQTCWNGRVAGFVQISTTTGFDSHVYVFDEDHVRVADLVPTPRRSAPWSEFVFSGDCTRILNHDENGLKILAVP